MYKTRIMLLGALTAFATACTLGPNFKVPQAPDKSVYSRSLPSPDTVSTTYGGDMADDWYTLFHSEGLNALVHQALANSPDLDAARHGLLAAQYELKAVAGTALPQIDGSGKIGRAHANGSFLYGPVNELDVTADQFAAGPALAYNLDVFGGIRRSIEAQRAATASVHEQVLNTYVTLVDQVVINAFDYAAMCAQIAVTQSLVEELRSQFELTRQLEQAGKGIRSDTLQAQTQLENTAATLPGLEQQRDTYRNALAQLTGSNPDEFRMPDLSLKDFSLPSDVPVSLPSDLVRHRPDILAAEDNLHQASASIGVAEAARFPSISLSASYAQQTSFINEFLTRPGGIWAFGADLAAPIYHGGTLAAREKEAREQYLQAQATYRKTVVVAFVEVANALQSIGHDRDGYRAHNRALDAARADSDLAQAQYRAGRYTELQVLTAQQQYQQAALTEVQADAQRFSDIASLFRALGGGWWNASRDPAFNDPALSPIASARPVPAAATTPRYGEFHD
jgi:NodT family efflux transporter outer membrane factor (OMF) lipoprotein